MRDRLRMPIEYNPGRVGYFYTEEVSSFPTLQITEGELFALVVAAVYWFVSYEPAGTTLLGLFGVASAFAAIVLARSQRRGAGRSPDGDALVDGPFADESGRIPSETFAPLQVGFGLAVAGLGLVFGPWLILAALLPIALGGLTWLGSAGAELEATEGSDPLPSEETVP